MMNLVFSSHISDICKKARKKVGVLIRLRNMIPSSGKLRPRPKSLF